MPPTSIAKTCAGHSTPSADARIDARDKHTASTLHIARCSSRYSKEGTTQHPSTSINIIFVCSADPFGLESRGVERCFPSSCSNPDCAKTCKWGMALAMDDHWSYCASTVTTWQGRGQFNFNTSEINKIPNYSHMPSLRTNYACMRI